ncbi:hypothetical protein SDC9_106670 [bioreactor metagenome]|uniref:Uncharacterized protein n=1 Tax=bioreactor metagenome TaxID=1076179 RepID=A0A645BDN6_9ZZZZ
MGPLQPYIAYFAIAIAITILSTLFWGYKYNLIFAFVFYGIAYFYFSYKHKSSTAENNWAEMGWPLPQGSENVSMVQEAMYVGDE